MDFEGTVRKEDSADGRTSIDVFDAAKLASKVAEWRKKPGHSGQELCDHADADKLRKFASEGGVCKAIVESVVHHEDVHVEQCKAGGAENRYNKMFGKTKSRFVAPADLNVAFMQYQMRPAKDRALGETQAYSEQIEYLATAMRPLLKGKGVKIIKGNRGGSADELAQLEVECNGKLGLGVQGLKYACIGVNGTRKNMFVEAEGFTCGDEGREPQPRGYWQFRLLVTLTDQGTGSPLDMPALCLSPGERAPDPHDVGVQCVVGGSVQQPQLTVTVLGNERNCSKVVRTVTAPVIRLESCEQPSAQGYRPPKPVGGRPNS